MPFSVSNRKTAEKVPKVVLRTGMARWSAAPTALIIFHLYPSPSGLGSHLAGGPPGLDAVLDRRCLPAMPLSVSNRKMAEKVLKVVLRTGMARWNAYPRLS